MAKQAGSGEEPDSQDGRKGVWFKQGVETSLFCIKFDPTKIPRKTPAKIMKKILRRCCVSPRRPGGSDRANVVAEVGASTMSLDMVAQVDALISSPVDRFTAGDVPTFMVPLEAIVKGSILPFQGNLNCPFLCPTTIYG